MVLLFGDVVDLVFLLYKLSIDYIKMLLGIDVWVFWFSWVMVILMFECNVK